MVDDEVAILKRALERERKARKQAENILREKSKEYDNTAMRLRDANERLENLLAQKDNELQGVFVNIVDPYVVMDVQGNIIKMNNSAKDFLEYDEEKDTDFNLNQLVHPDDRQYTKDSFRILYNKGQFRNYRARIILRSGIEREVLINSSLIYNKDGMPIAAQGIIRDVTKENEIKRLLSSQKEELKSSQQQLSSLILNMPIGITLEDENRNIKLVNQLFCDTFGLTETPNELIGAGREETAKKYMHLFANPEEVVTRVHEILQDRELVLMEELDLVDGRVLIREYVPIYSQGEYKGGLWTYNDITFQKKYNLFLESQKEKFSGIIANMNLGLIETDENDSILLVNQSFCKMSGLTEKELIGQKAVSIFNPSEKHAEYHRDRLEKRKKGISDSYEMQLEIKDRGKRFWLISAAPRIDDNGTHLGSIAICMDITDRKSLELQKEQLLEELENRNNELQEYAHIVSHDLKSPLRNINALASWLYEDYKDKLDDNGIFQLRAMQDKVEAMDKLVDGILKYSTVNAETLGEEDVNINDVIEDIKGIIFIPNHVEVKTANELPTIKADKTKVHQLFQNIISNAVVHIEEDKEGQVVVGSTETETHWQFTIADNGIGIKKEYHEKIFKIFQSVGNKERSTGIGLSIVKKILDLYNGKVWLESELGKGTTFYFTLSKTKKEDYRDK